MNARVLLWTSRAPDPLADSLTAAGFRVWEALAVTEVTYLCETENIDLIIISAEVDGAALAELRQHYATMKLNSAVTSEELIEALWQLFPDRAATVQ